MSEMIERVARAICVSNSENPDHETRESYGLKNWQLREIDARAAIEAMRDPPAPMAFPRVWSELIDAILSEQ